MQSEYKITRNHFLKDYQLVLEHHMNCILESRMMLDEDLHLLLTFWIPSTTAYNKNVSYSTATCAVSAVVGCCISSKLNRLYPFLASLTPTIVHLSRKTSVLYYTRMYRSNCELLISLLRKLHDINRAVLEYNHRVVLNIPNMTASGLSLFKTTRCDFLRFVTATLMAVLQNFIAKIREISSLVPITEAEYMYAAEWDLQHFSSDNSADFSEVLHHFENLSDLSILIVSNFLTCIGLTLCVQLWKDNATKFHVIFDEVIPQLCRFLDKSVSDIEYKFTFMRDTLVEPTDEYKKQIQLRKPSTYIQLHQPLDDFLLNTQVLFDVVANLRLLLENDKIKDRKELSLALDNVDQQYAKCGDLLESVVRMLRTVTKHRGVTNPEVHSNPVPSVSYVTPVEVHQEDNSVALLDDEEYSLSIHGSEYEDDIIAPIMDFAEHCSSDNLEMMLVELKRKLEERKLQKIGAEVGCVVEVVKPDDPVPPPPPSIPCLPPFDASRGDFLSAVQIVAQNLNREEEFQFGFNMFPEIPRPFNTSYRCYSVAMLPGNERQDVERGGKIIMPPSALEQLTRLNINYPMLFKIINKKTNRTSHCGVLEFVADEGKVYLPLWMMHNLVLEENDLLQIESVSLPVGTFAKFQPLAPEFLDITNPKAVLENCLRTFACLTTGDVIAVKYNQKTYELCVLETQPGNAISIIECDMNVEFAAPIGYKEAEVSKSDDEEMTVDPADLMPEPSGFVAFKGTGNRLDGKRRKDSTNADTPVQKPVYVRGIPDYDYQIGTLRFLRNVIKSQTVDKEENSEFKVFSGKGFSLKRV